MRSGRFLSLRDITFFILGFVFMFAIVIAVEWDDFKRGLTAGYEAARQEAAPPAEPVEAAVE